MAEIVHYTYIHSPIGYILLASIKQTLCFLQLGDCKQAMKTELARAYPQAVLVVPEMLPIILKKGVEAVKAYLSGMPQSFDIPLYQQGTLLQQKVWDYLRTIPAGKCVTYAEVARAVDHPKAVRAVASACSRNNLAIIIPCHRVVRSSGALAGYRWGLERKQALLALEVA